MGTAQVEKMGTANSLAVTQRRGDTHLMKSVSEVVENYTQWAAVDPVEEEESHSERCECCGLMEECTVPYIDRTKEKFCGHFVCGLCAEAVKEERSRMGKGTAMEDGLRAHMNMCFQFNTSPRTDPVVHLADTLKHMLRRSVDASRSPRSSPGYKWQRAGLSRSESCVIIRRQTSAP